MLILTLRIVAMIFILVGTIIGIFRFGSSLQVGFLTIISSVLSGLLFLALAAILEYLQRIADNTDYLLSRFHQNTTKKTSYPEQGKVYNEYAKGEEEPKSALEKVIKQNNLNWQD